MFIEMNKNIKSRKQESNSKGSYNTKYYLICKIIFILKYKQRFLGNGTL